MKQLSTAGSSASIDQSVAARTAPPLTGRSAELSKLTAALQSAESSHGSTVIIAGESGIGKTRLAHALIEVANRRNFVVALGRAYPVETGVPYAIFSAALLPILR